MYHALREHMPAIQAQELQHMIQATVAPHTKKGALSRMIRQLKRIVRSTLPPPQRPPMQIIEHDPGKAAEYLAAAGVRLSKKEKE